ncbi:hypothetical protein WG66_015012 [Moniliophthora roreri]|nr:hypothetical protein WG66_015012 [Moniliophthora roreri]
MGSEATSIRTFRPEDLSAVQALYLDATIYRRGSPFRVLVSRFFANTLWSHIAYISLAIGLWLLVLRPTNSPYVRVLGGLLIVTFISFIVGMVYTLLHFYLRRRSSLREDLEDVAAHYRIPASSSTSDPTPNGFWVAEIENKVVGCVGLGYFYDANPTQGEVRRAAVSSCYRRRDIAKKLMHRLIAHARNHDLETLTLNTKELYDTALKMYMESGWEVVRMRRRNKGPFVSFEAVDCRLELGDERKGKGKWIQI